MDKPKPVEIYVRPHEAPALAIDDGNNVRLYYAGQWIDFRNGVVEVRRDITDPAIPIIKRKIESGRVKFRPPGCH